MGSRHQLHPDRTAADRIVQAMVVIADTDFICPYCGAEFCNTFALTYHVKRCEAQKGKTEPEESK